MNVKIVRMDAVKKTWLIDPELIRQAQKISGARTETETVTRALREIVVRDEIDKAFRRHSPALAHLEAIFPDPVQRRKK
jgi:Arc/MetJ family transcription regulator